MNLFLRRLIELIFLAATVLGIILRYYYEESDLNHDYRDLKDSKPIMHTFFEPIIGSTKNQTNKGKTLNQGSGMSTAYAHEQLLKEWSRSWEEAGWTTKILSLEDAMNYPQYDEIYDFLRARDFGQYDLLCFLRWFAMVSIGGGWMSDYDVFPLDGNIPPEYLGKKAPVTAQQQKYSVTNKSRKWDTSATKLKWKNNGGIPLPNNGKFTMHDIFPVPSLSSGSKEEWHRVARGLIDMLHKHMDGFYSDMFALDDYDAVYPDTIAKENSVIWKLSNVMSDVREINCTKVWKGSKIGRGEFWAVHFSHWNVQDASKNNVLKEGLGRDDRAEIAHDFLSDWNKQCAKRKTSCFKGSYVQCS